MTEASERTSVPSLAPRIALRHFSARAFFFLCTSISAFATMLLPTPSQAGERIPNVLERTRPWEINYDADACHLLAPFGSGDDQIIAKFTRFQPGDRFDLTFYGKPLDNLVHHSDARIDFGPVENPREVTALNGKSGDFSALLIRSLRLDDNKINKDDDNPELEITPEYESHVSELNVKFSSSSRNSRFVLRTMGPPMRAMRACLTDLVKTWGFDPAEQAALQRRPTPKAHPGRWLSWTDFPKDMNISRANGLVQFRLDIDAQGIVTACHIQQASQPSGFAELTCELISARARFLPALDKNGQPIASFYVNSALWFSP